MIKVAIKSIGKTFSIENSQEGNWNVQFDNSKNMLLENVVTNKKKKQFYKRTTVLSLYAIKEALQNANIDLNNYDRNRIGLYSFEKESNNIKIEDTYKKLIQFCQQIGTREESFSDVFSKCYSLSDLFKIMPHLSNHLISAELGIEGANKTLLTGEGADLQSLIDASNDVHENRFDMAICGSSTSNYSVLEQKQMAEFYNYNLSEKEIKESSVYIVLGNDNDSSLYIRGGKSFYIKEHFNFLEKKIYFESLFDNFFKANNSLSRQEIDFILFLDQYNKPSTIIESEIFKDLFINSEIVTPRLDNNNNICNGFFYLSLLYNNIYDFKNAIVIQKNHNNIITFILITK